MVWVIWKQYKRYITIVFLCCTAIFKYHFNKRIRSLIMKRDLTLQEILLSLLGFVILWAVVTDAWDYSGYLHISYGSYIYAYLSRLIWVMSAICLIVRYSDSLNYNRKKLFSHPVLNKSFVIVLSVLYKMTCKKSKTCYNWNIKTWFMQI